MEGINCRNVQKYVANHNQEVNKVLENIPNASLEIESILGTHTQNLKESLIYILSAQQVLYYSSEYFIVHNLISKQNTVIRREGCFNHKTIFIDHFVKQKKTDIIFTIQKYNNNLYIGQLQILGRLTEQNNSVSWVSQNFRWKLSKLNNKCNYSVENMSYHFEKNYVYMIASQINQDKRQKYLWIYDLNRECMIMSPLIKPSISKITINRVWVTDEPTEVYLMGKNYFRFWTLSFNQKSMKESNYRNIQRSLYDKEILKLFYCYYQNTRVLGILSAANLLFLKTNELLHVQSPPQRLIKKNKNKDNILLELENSLNQIYRMKFQIDQQDNQRKQVQDFIMTPDTPKNLTDQFTYASQIWEGENGDSITIATKSGNILTYVISNGQMKLINQINAKKSYHFDFITVSKKGEVIILSEKKCQGLYIINKYALNTEENGQELRPFWGMGHISIQNIISMDSPALHQRLCTLGANQNLKLWSFNGRQRKILFQQKLSNQPSKIAMHPCGLLLAINYMKQIKLMSLLPTGVYEVMSAKTNYHSIGLKYSECGNILVSNQQNLLIFYNPFTLKALGYIQPAELKCTILDFQLTHDGNFIVYHTSDFGLYIQSLQLHNYNKFENLIAGHNQKQVYKCFYFEENLSTQDSMTKQAKVENIFIGCTQNKYMVLYKNFGKQLIAEFPSEDCYIQALSVVDGWLFAATSKSTIRVYKWPMKESQLQLEIIDLEKKIVKMKQPSYKQFIFWNDDKKITSFHKLGFSNKLVVAREGGSLTILNYNKFVAERYEQTGERNKLTQIVNDTFYIKKNESEKRNRLIEKTQGDILKVQIQISKEKSVLQRKFAQQCRQIQRNFEQKNDLNFQQKIQYLKKLKEENQELKITIDKRQTQIQGNQIRNKHINVGKKMYEDQRNNNIEISTKEIVASHKKKIQDKIVQHKKAINSLKSVYRDKIKAMKGDFEGMVANQYPALNSKKNMTQNQKNLLQDRKTSINVEETNLIDTETLGWQNRQNQIEQLNAKVQETTKNKWQLQHNLQEIKCKVRNAQSEDQNMQKQFQKYLQLYNSSRFTNLSLHSDVLKIRTQLIERKQIMENKQEIINAAFQQRQKLENYKQLVKGSLSKLQSRKQQLFNQFTQKENEVSLVFEELHNNLLEYQKLKMEEQRSKELQNVLVNNKKVEEDRVENSINRLKELKRFLLLQGLTDDMQHKKMYVQRQNLLNNVNFYKKRLNMESMKQKKNKILKKSALNLVLKQNKNLIEQCNQLRGQTIKYDHELKNLSKKIGEAQNIISIESKLKDQKYVVLEQRNQLQAIRALFTDQIASYNQSVQLQQNDI